ncbi:hypothetical protein BCR39DRAFT_522650 [Naematelia encephala]|uniref:Uncharacterized protein n=1 Tax=Naematelia encephala TaxID=71784 RepID=A0A1Y2BCF6_9TREE|nr:hypothetical protein BCR39DRAFT_522650 [Naematelia encephala]
MSSWSQDRPEDLHLQAITLTFVLIFSSPLLSHTLSNRKQVPSSVSFLSFPQPFIILFLHPVMRLANTIESSS